MKHIKFIATIFCTVMLTLLSGCIIADHFKYSQAMTLYENGDYHAARDSFDALDDYSDSAEMVKRIDYSFAVKDMELAFNRQNPDALNDTALLFQALGEYTDSADRMTQCRNEAIYISACSFLDSKDYIGATGLFNKIFDYKDSADLSAYCINCYTYNDALARFESGDYPSAHVIFDLLGDFNDSAEMAEKAYKLAMDDEYTKALLLYDEGKYEAAASILRTLGDYKKSREIFISALENTANEAFSNKDYSVASAFYSILADNGFDKGRADIKTDFDAYNRALLCLNSGNLGEAYEIFTILGDYGDSAKQLALVNVLISGGDIFTLHEMGLITFEFRGSAVNKVMLTVSNVSKYDLNLFIERCTWLTPSRNDNQNMLLYEDTHVLIASNTTHQLPLKTACLNIELVVSDDTVVFTPQKPSTLSRGETLSALLNVAAQSSFPALQAAVWIVTDGASFEAMGYLQRENGERVITREVYEQALDLLFGERGSDLIN